MSSFQRDPDNRGDFSRPLDPRTNADYQDYEELYPVEDYDLELVDILTMAARVAIIIIFIVSYIFVFINVARGHRLKNWRLYVLVALVLFCWLGLSLYQDHIDQYFVHAIYR